MIKLVLNKRKQLHSIALYCDECKQLIDEVYFDDIEHIIENRSIEIMDLLEYLEEEYFIHYTKGFIFSYCEACL